MPTPKRTSSYFQQAYAKTHWYNRTGEQATELTFINELNSMIDSYQNNSDFLVVPLINNPRTYEDYVIKNVKTNRIFQLALPAPKAVFESPEYLQGMKNRFSHFDSSIFGNEIVKVDCIAPVSNGRHWVLATHSLELNSENKTSILTRGKTIDSLRGNLDGTKQHDSWSCGFHALDNAKNLLNGNFSLKKVEEPIPQQALGVEIKPQPQVQMQPKAQIISPKSRVEQASVQRQQVQPQVQFDACGINYFNPYGLWREDNRFGCEPVKILAQPLTYTPYLYRNPNSTEIRTIYLPKEHIHQDAYTFINSPFAQPVQTEQSNIQKIESKPTIFERIMNFIRK